MAKCLDDRPCLTPGVQAGHGSPGLPPPALPSPYPRPVPLSHAERETDHWAWQELLHANPTACVAPNPSLSRPQTALPDRRLGGPAVSQVVSSLQSARVGGKEGSLASAHPGLGECEAARRIPSGSLLGDSRAGMCLEQEASQQECKVSAQGSVWPQKNTPPPMYTPLQTMPMRHALMVMEYLDVCVGGKGGYTRPSHRLLLPDWQPRAPT